MQSSLVITTPAADLSLLSITELRQAAGIEGNGSDTQLYAMGVEVSGSIAAACNVTPGITGPITLRKERVTETFWNVCTHRLILGRQHEVSVVSIVDAGATLSASDYVVNPAGSIIRLSSDAPTYWSSTKVVVVYDAGFQTVPGDLKSVAMEMMKQSWTNASSTVASGVKSQTIKVIDIEETRVDYFDGSSTSSSGSSSGAVPDAVAGKLARFRNISIV